MIKKILFIPLLIGSFYSYGQNWKLVNEGEAYPMAKNEYKEKRNQKIFKLQRNSLDEVLINVNSRSSNQTGTVLVLPNADGELERFEVWEASNLSTKDQAKYPNIRSYVGKSLKDSSYLRFSTGPSGISSTIFRDQNKSEFLETYSKGGEYFEVHSKTNKGDFNCLTPEVHESLKSIANKNNSKVQIAENTFKTYRLALSVTGEYSQVFGGTVEKSLEAMNNTMTRVNGVFEKELSVNFILTDDIEKLIYLDPNTDPYSNEKDGMKRDSVYTYTNRWNVELQRNLRDNFGENNYDIGHLFGHAGGGGNAGCIGCICETDFPIGKGSGFTSPYIGLPKGDAFDIDFVAHEIGHQIGANHTFSFSYEDTGKQVQVEPGSGSTIMSYAGITYYNVQRHSDDYFSHASLKQIQDNLENKTCGITRPILNTAPKIEIENTVYNIPIGTAFKLNSKVSDNENDDVVVAWEQNDTGTFFSIGVNSRVRSIKTSGPNFRSYKPVKETYRYFPSFQKILNDSLIREIRTEPNPNEFNEPNIQGESLTTVPRTYNFTVTARDYNVEGPQNSYGEVKVMVVNNTQAFKIIKPSIDDKLGINKNNFDVTWEVGNTNLAPINTSKVKISISWDGGSTFKELGIVDNTGSANFSLPTDAKDVTDGYIMIEAVDNIFLAVKKFETDSSLASNDIEIKNTNLIYPNPSNGSFYIEQKSTGNVNLEIVDFNGRIVYSNNYNSSGNFKKQINTNLPKGIYIIKIGTNDGVTTSKLIIN